MILCFCDSLGRCECSACCRKISDRILEDGAHCKAFFLENYVVFVEKIVLFSDGVVPRKEYLPDVRVD